VSCEAHILPLTTTFGLPAVLAGHAPVEVTDGCPAAPADVRTSGSVWRATGHEEPIFLDRSGRRKHLVGVLAVMAATLSVGWLGALLTGAAGFSDLPAGTLAVASVPRPAVVISDTADRARLSSAVVLPLGHRRALADLDGREVRHRRGAQRLTRA